ncbi:MAG TPA: BON domain-containing protein [Thermoanaerobaculia bacterium]|nr:BON domain-containing protein [Thermoanaerobaculia bacterium]
MERSLIESVNDELRWNPSITAEKIAVDAVGSMVVLQGTVHTYVEKCRAEQIVRAIRGVGSVRNQLEVRLTVGDYRTDATLERLTNEILESLALLPEERPVASVNSGWVTLRGQVQNGFQKRLAEEAIRGVAGVRGLTNRLQVVAPERADIGSGIQEAMRRRSIGESVILAESKGRVSLHGSVSSCREHDEILDVVFSAVGVQAVEDHLVVG